MPAAPEHDTGRTGSRRRPGPRTGVVVALGVAAALAVGAGAFKLGDRDPEAVAAGRSVSPPAARGDGTPVPDRSRLLAPEDGHKYFGISAAHAPWRSSVLRGIGKKAGVAPNMVEYVVNWTQDFDPGAVRAAYGQRALPVISWEPWAGKRAGTAQPAYRLRTIIDGKHDRYLRAFAADVADSRLPVAVRLAHEMNGTWYPWAEKWNGNRPGEYAAAWKHIHRIFAKAGADNVIWIWSPNIIRNVAPVDFKALYPGDAYVDWVGVTAYDVTEYRARQVLEPTLDQFRRFTRKPLLITETGAQPGAQKVPYIRDLFRWLKGRPDVLGFVWFQARSTSTGANWAFDSGPQAEAAFRAGAKTLPLVAVPDPARKG